MFNFKFKYILSFSFFMLSALITSNSFSSLTKAECVYYENNKWDFMEKEFVNKVDSMYKDLGVSPTFFILPVFISSAIFFTKIELEKKLLIFDISAILLTIANYLRLKDKPRPVDVDQVEKNLLIVMNDFFENYSIEKKDNLITNYRDFVPGDLVSTFDAIYKNYLEDGPNCLDYFSGIISKVTDKILYKVKKEKYQRIFKISQK